MYGDATVLQGDQRRERRVGSKCAGNKTAEEYHLYTLVKIHICFIIKFIFHTGDNLKRKG